MMITLNFHDDGSHVTAHRIDDVIGDLDRLGVATRAAGYVDMPYFVDILKSVGISAQPPGGYILDVAMWLKTLFSAYVVGVKR